MYNTTKSYLKVKKKEAVKIMVDGENFNQYIISLLTLYSAKGLEFPVVFIYKPVEGVMPYLEKMDVDIQEERRLFYVGMTRAKIKLFFIIPEKMKKYGQLIITEPSPIKHIACVSIIIWYTIN